MLIVKDKRWYYFLTMSKEWRDQRTLQLKEHTDVSFRPE